VAAADRPGKQEGTARGPGTQARTGRPRAAPDRRRGARRHVPGDTERAPGGRDRDHPATRARSADPGQRAARGADRTGQRGQLCAVEPGEPGNAVLLGHRHSLRHAAHQPDGRQDEQPRRRQGRGGPSAQRRATARWAAGRRPGEHLRGERRGPVVPRAGGQRARHQRHRAGDRRPCRRGQPVRRRRAGRPEPGRGHTTASAMHAVVTPGAPLSAATAIKATVSPLHCRAAAASPPRRCRWPRCRRPRLPRPEPGRPARRWRTGWTLRRGR